MPDLCLVMDIRNYNHQTPGKRHMPQGAREKGFIKEMDKGFVYKGVGGVEGSQ